MTIDQKLFEMLFEQAKASSRLRANYDMRTSLDDTSQRMLNALIPGSEIPIHKHEDTAESVFCLCGRLDEVLFEEVVDYTNEAINTESEISVEIARLVRICFFIFMSVAFRLIYICITIKYTKKSGTPLFSLMKIKQKS